MTVGGGVALENIDGISGLRSLQEIEANRLSSWGWGRDVERYQVKLLEAAGKPVPDIYKKKTKESKKAGSGLRQAFIKVKKLFKQRNFDHVNQGLELARSLGESGLFDIFLEGISYEPSRVETSDSSTWHYPGRIVLNSVFKESR